MQPLSLAGLSLAGTGSADDADSGSVDLTGTYSGGTITNATGWKINGDAMTTAVLTTGTNFVSLSRSGSFAPGATVTYDGTGPMPINAGSVTLT